jgi:HK97 family phage portal protein
MFVSDGSLVTTKTPVDWARGTSYFPYMPPMSTQGWPSAYAGIYSRQLWVYVVVSKRAKATARLPLPVYRREDLNRPRVDDHPMSLLLSNPNPGMTGFDLWRWTSATFDIYGDTFWYKRRRRGQVEGLYPLHPSSMAYNDGSWSFDNGRLVLRDIPDADLVRFRDFNPDSLSRGMSPLEPLRSTLENEWSARVATSSFWARGARPGTALLHKGSLSQDATNRLKAQWDAVAGGAGNTGGTVVLEEGMEPKALTLTAEEAQYIETRKLNREEVCAAYDIPPPVVHILDHATFSNITEQMRSMYRDTMAPHLKGFEAAIELDLRRAEWPDDDVYAEFLMDEVLRGDFETRQDALAKASHMTIAEKRKVENLPFIEGTDRIFLNTATMPLDAIDAQSAAIVAQTEQSANPLAEVIPLAAARSVMGRLSWQTSLDQIDARALTDGLAEAHQAAVIAALSDVQDKGGSVADLRYTVRLMASEEK